MKKIGEMILCLLVSASLAGCSSGSASASPNSSVASSSESDSVMIGGIQFMEHAALDRATEGFKTALSDNGYVEGKNLTFDLQNAQGDLSNCETIANKLINEGVSLIFANATPAAQAVAAKTTDIPVVITSVTDPESSGLVESNTAPGGNITGTSDLTPVQQQIDLLVQLLPEAETIAIMYTGSEDNSIFQAAIAKEAAEAAGLKTIEFTVTDSNSIQSVAQSMVGKVDAVYIPTDNLLAEGMANVASVCNANNLPVIVGESGMVENGGLASYGIDYYNLGYKTGEMAVKILKGADPASMPIEYLPTEECELTINQTAADELGLTIPEDLLAKAVIVK